MLIRSSWRIQLAALLLLAVASGCSKKVVRPDGDVGDVGDGGPRIIEHEIVAGETLRRIADNYYGDPERAEQIARQNGLTDPNRIVPGSVLRLVFDEQEWSTAQKRATALQSYNRGVELLGQDKLDMAEQQFRRAVTTAPDLLAARYNLALVLLKRGHHDEALGLLEQLTEVRPDDTDFRFARGNALFLLTRFDEAVTQFAAVIERDAGHKRAAFGLARSLQEGGHTERAISAWQRYLELDSSSRWADVARRNLTQLQEDGQ